MTTPQEDTGLLMMRVILITAWGAICFGAGTLYAPQQKFAACIEIPKKSQTQYPKTKAEVQRFIISYLRQGQGVVK